MPEMGEKSSGNKAKKSKSDLFRSSLGYYLKQKSYVGSEKFRKSDFLLLQNKRQFMVQKMLDLDLQCGNSFAYSNVLCITNNHHIVDQQFGRFSQFVESQNDFIRLELRRFYAPMMCHLYIELLKAREQKAALELLKKYAQLIAPVETYDAPLPTKINGCSVAHDAPHSDQNHVSAAIPHTSIRFVTASLETPLDPELMYFIKLIQTLSTCIKLETAENDPDISHFRAAKYEIHTTEAVVDVLRTYMEKRGHVLILNILYSWIHVHVVDNEVHKWNEDHILLGFAGPEEDEEEECIDVKPKITTANERLNSKRLAEELPEQLVVKTEKFEDNGDDIKNLRAREVEESLQTLRMCREQALNSQSQYPHFIKLADRGRGLTSAHVDTAECHLVAGFNTSVVQLWQLNQQTLRGKNLYAQCADSVCRWELNNVCADQSETEDQIDVDVREHMRLSSSNNDRGKRKFEAGKYESNSFNEYGGILLRGHGAGITDVRFSAHYPLIYSASKDATIRSWRAENFGCTYIYRGHRYPVWCLDESPVGMYLATGSKDLTARLWSLERDFPLITYAGHTQDVECIAFHPNGSYLATGSADLSLRLWCVTSGKLMRVFSECKQPITSIAFSPDGKMLAAGGEESKIRIFDLAAGAQLNELKEHTANVNSISWSKGGRYIASVCRDGSLREWDVKKLSPMNESSSTTNSYASSSSSSSTTLNRVMALSSNCQRLVKVMFSKQDEMVCAIGSC
ncbi:TAF5-like RNA polymerase II p300/CBP-associated factor-associated factor 65 kDa subunit 5L [Eurosta solidaginis]|uniref:TAF5-like RNA polymerase II p300/CBP-associated factor-associated factor 65 kDa subunit 5L n=1 Tax=Eurosta solidaginis TaxID=178769 RepID=UPI003531720D